MQECLRDESCLRPSGCLLGPEFFARGADEVARDLIGKIIWREGRGGGRLSEVEAYLPANDPACHAAKGLTRRNSAMFGPPGSIYVFLSYGIHYLLNLVCEREGVGAAVLIRSFEGARGPGVVGRLLGITPELNGSELGEPSGLYLIDDGTRPPVGVTVRVGISRGSELPLRYYWLGSPYVSRLGREERGPAR